MICDIKVIRNKQETTVPFKTDEGTVDINLDLVEVVEADETSLYELEYEETKKYLIKEGENELGSIYIGNLSGGGTEITILSSNVYKSVEWIDNKFLRFIYTILEKLGLARYKNGILKVNAGRGIGEVAYIKLAQEVSRRYDLILTSDESRTEYADSLWEKLVSKGMAEKIKIDSEKADYVYQFKKIEKEQFKEVPQCL